jgi:predicted nucleotidyltransferase
MSQQALLRRVVRALDGAGVPHMLTGSLASSLQGEPRATHDIDLVIDAAGAEPLTDPGSPAG